MIRNLLALFLILLPMSVMAVDALWSQVLNTKKPPASFLTHSEKLSSTEVLRGDFIQRRTMKILKHPLISTGKFVYSKEQGLLWQLLTPFQSSYLISQEIVRRTADGVQAQDRVMESMSKMLSAMFSGNFQHLERYFDLYYLDEDKSWTIGMSANTSVVKKIIGRIVLRGKTHIESITIFESSGDVVEINFNNLIDTPITLSQQEAEHFSNAP